MVRILVPTAGPAAAAETADYVMQVSKSIDAKVLVLHVVRSGGARESGELCMETMTTAAKANSVEVECHFREGAVISQIVDFAEENEVDLIVMGASNGRIFESWVSSDVRQNTTIPVLVIPYQITG